MSAARVKTGFSVTKAHETQLRLSKQIIHADVLPNKLRFVAGVDVAYVRKFSIGAAVVLDYSSLEVLESKTVFHKTDFPYVPTLLSFREIPPTVLSIRRLDLQPDIILVDGHGFAHPYRCGLASHLGLVTGKPTIGIAKSRLFGYVEDSGDENVKLLKHRDEVVGVAFATKLGCRSVYVSVGHMVSLETAVKVVRHCTRNHRMPEPILQAHQIAAREKRKAHISSIADN